MLIFKVKPDYVTKLEIQLPRLLIVANVLSLHYAMVLNTAAKRSSKKSYLAKNDWLEFPAHRCCLQ